MKIQKIRVEAVTSPVIIGPKRESGCLNSITHRISQVWSGVKFLAKKSWNGLCCLSKTTTKLAAPVLIALTAEVIALSIILGEHDYAIGKIVGGTGCVIAGACIYVKGTVFSLPKKIFHKPPQVVSVRNFPWHRLVGGGL